MGWTKCSDRMPDYRVAVLVTDGALVALSCRSRLDEVVRNPWQTTYQAGDSVMTPGEITHWQALPEPPTD